MIKRCFMVLLVFSFVFVFCKNENLTLVCFGDSLMAGYGAVVPKEDDKEKSVPAFLQSKINIPVINAGVSGNTTAQGLERIDADVLLRDPGIVIIELGANDLMQNVPLADTHNNLQKIIDKVNNGKRKIFLVKFYTDEVARALITGLFNISDYSMQTAIINQYDDMFELLASSNNAELISDIWAGVWGIHMSDNMHPNEAGYKIMADNYFNAIKFYLENNSLVK